MKRLGSFIVAAFLLFAPAAQAANSTVSAMTAASAFGGTELLYVVQGAADRKGTPAQFATYIYGLASGDCTISGVGAVVCTKTNGSAFTALATTAPGTGVATALGVNVGSAGAFVTFNGALGTPSSGTLTNATGLPISGTTGWGTSVAAALAAALNGSAGPIGALTPTNNNCVVGNGSAWTSAACPGGGSSTITAGSTATSGITTGHFLGASSNLVVDQTAVTSVAAGCGTSTGGSAITGTGTVLAASTLRINTTTSDPVVAGDCGNTVYENNASSIAVGIAAAGTTGFAAGTLFNVCNINAGVATITPTTSTIGGAASKAIAAGSATNPTCLAFQSDGTNYNIITLPAPAGLYTVTGALKGNGSGTVAQAACSDLSNGTALCSTTPGTGVATAAAANLSAAGGLTSTIASGTSALGTGAIGSAACASVVTTGATNVATTDTLTGSFNQDPTGVTGYAPSASGMLTIIGYPTSGNVNWKVCNNTSGSITPGAITLNWRVTR